MPWSQVHSLLIYKYYKVQDMVSEVVVLVSEMNATIRCERPEWSVQFDYVRKLLLNSPSELAELTLTWSCVDTTFDRSVRKVKQNGFSIFNKSA